MLALYGPGFKLERATAIVTCAVPPLAKVPFLGLSINQDWVGIPCQEITPPPILVKVTTSVLLVAWSATPKSSEFCESFRCAGRSDMAWPTTVTAN